jgi:hypothetical protein
MLNFYYAPDAQCFVASWGAAIGCLLSSVFNRSITIKNIGGVVAEALLDTLLSWV